MPIGENDIRPGAVYVLDDYVYVQVLSVSVASVTYRVRRRNVIARAIMVKKSTTRSRFVEKALAEVNGEYFPDFTDLRGYRYQRSEAESVSLRDHLARRALHRPFVTG